VCTWHTPASSRCGLRRGKRGDEAPVEAQVVDRRQPLGQAVADAEQMVLETAAGKIMRGVRGQPPRDIAQVVDTLRRVGQLVHDFPCISELDINPLIVNEQGRGVTIADARIILES